MTLRGSAVVFMLGLFLVVCVAFAGAQERRTVAVNVVDEQGRQVTGLTAENFRGKFRGKPVRIVSAEWETGPRRIVILLDQSGSMAWGKKWEVARKAAEDVVFYGPPENQLAMVVFREKPEEVVGFEQGRAAVAKRLGELMQSREQGEGRTGMYDAIMEGMRLLGSSREGDALYVVTDAGENASRTKERELQRTILCSEVRVFFFFFQDPDRTARGPEYLLGERLAERLSQDSGGYLLGPAPSGDPASWWRSVEYVLTPEQRQEIAAGVRWLYELMGSYYRVEVELPVEVDKVRGWELEVVDEAGKKMKGVRMVYPRKVGPCGEGGGR